MAERNVTLLQKEVDRLEGRPTPTFLPLLAAPLVALLTYTRKLYTALIYNAIQPHFILHSFHSSEEHTRPLTQGRHFGEGYMYFSLEIFTEFQNLYDVYQLNG